MVSVEFLAQYPRKDFAWVSVSVEPLKTTTESWKVARETVEKMNRKLAGTGCQVVAVPVPGTTPTKAGQVRGETSVKLLLKLCLRHMK